MVTSTLIALYWPEHAWASVLHLTDLVAAANGRSDRNHHEPPVHLWPKPDGSGLGVSQVYGFAQQAGSAAAVESKRRGYLGQLHLPRALASQELRNAPRAAALGAT